MFSTFYFCLLKIWLTGPASRETPFSFDKGPVRGKGSFKGSRIRISDPASQGLVQGKHGALVVSVPLKQSSGWKTPTMSLFRHCPFLRPCFNNPNYWCLLNGLNRTFFFSFCFLGARILASLILSYLGPKNVNMNRLGSHKG